MVDSDVVTARVSFLSFTVPSNIIIWFYSMQKFRVCFFRSKMWNASRFCVSSLRRGHANLCIVPILVYVPPKQVHLGKVSVRSHDRGVFHHTLGISSLYSSLLLVLCKTKELCNCDTWLKLKPKLITHQCIQEEKFTYFCINQKNTKFWINKIHEQLYNWYISRKV